MLPGAFPERLLLQEDYELLSYSSERVAIYRRGTLKVYNHAGEELSKLEIMSVRQLAVLGRRVLVVQGEERLSLVVDGEGVKSVTISGMKQAIWYSPAERILVCSAHQLQVLDRQQLKTLDTIPLVHGEDPRLECVGMALCEVEGWPCLVILWQDGDLSVQCPFLLYPLLNLPLDRLTRELSLKDDGEEGEETAALCRLLASLQRHCSRDGVIQRGPSILRSRLSPTRLLNECLDVEYEAIWPCGKYLIGQRGHSLNVMKLVAPVRLTKEEVYPVELGLIKTLQLTDTKPCGQSPSGVVLTRGGFLSFDLEVIALRDPAQLIPAPGWSASLELAMASIAKSKLPRLPRAEITVPRFTPLPIPTTTCSFPAELNMNSCLELVEAIKQLKISVLPPLIGAGEEIRQRALALEETIRLHAVWSRKLNQASKLIAQRSEQLLQVQGEVMKRETILLKRWQRVAHLRADQLEEFARKLVLKPVELNETLVLKALLQLQSDTLSRQ